MPENQFKRNIAFKLRIGDILSGKPIIEGDRFSFLDLNGKRVVRVNVVGNIVDKYENEGEKRYSFLTLDDGSGQIKLKVFGDDVKKVEGINQGQTVVVIGVLRNFNNETYIFPEIIKEQDTKYLIVRKLETEKTKTSQPVSKEQIFAVKDKVLNLIRNSEDAGGIEIEKLTAEIKGASQEIINQEVQKLIEEGVIFEPRPGKVRYLG